MHLLNCIFVVVMIATVVHANCYFRNVYFDKEPTCQICEFENLSNITERVIPNGCVKLFFDNCHFGRFHKDLVNPADQVYVLWMRDSVEFIENSAFDDYKETHSIVFRKNNVSLLPDFAFRGLSNLRVVDFSENQIVKIGEDVFTGASSITDLNLAHNRIESFCIKQLFNLQSVNLESNFITVLSELPKTLSAARFTSNRLTKIANVTFRNMKSLQNVELGFNHIMEIETGAFYGAEKLEFVNLMCNELSVWNVMEGNKLHGLDFIHNETVISNGKYAKFHLKLRCNKITSFSLGNLNSYDATVLSYLDLTHNSIQQLDKSKFNVTTNIEILDLNYNKIKTVPIAFFHSQYRENRIIHLFLRGNEITQLEVGSFLGLALLENLDLSSNRIQTLNETIFFNTPNLQKLNLANNRIRNLNGPEIVGLTRLHFIWLNGNSFSNLNYVTEEFTNNNVRVTNDDYRSIIKINFADLPALI